MNQINIEQESMNYANLLYDYTKKKILIVEDDAVSGIYLKKTLVKMGYIITSIVSSGEAAFSAINQEKPDLILMDIILEGNIDGIESAKKIKMYFNIPVVFMTTTYSKNLINRSKEAAPYGFIIKPFGEKEIMTILPLVFDRYCLEEELKKSIQAIKNTLSGGIGVIGKIIEMRDPYTAGHQKRVGLISKKIAEKMGYNKNAVETIHTAALLHDLGKISIPAEILSKPSNLSDEEFSLIKMHPTTGYNILKNFKIPEIIKFVVYQHHERVDGTGYPLGLTKNKIEPESKIIAVADTVEAIISHRPYRPSLGLKFAMKKIKNKKNILYDNNVVNACVELFEKDNFTLE